MPVHDSESYVILSRAALAGLCGIVQFTTLVVITHTRRFCSTRPNLATYRTRLEYRACQQEAPLSNKLQALQLTRVLSALLVMENVISLLHSAISLSYRSRTLPVAVLVVPLARCLTFHRTTRFLRVRASLSYCSPSRFSALQAACLSSSVHVWTVFDHLFPP